MSADTLDDEKLCDGASDGVTYSAGGENLDGKVFTDGELTLD